MNFKKTSMLFDNGIRRRIKQDPSFQFSKGLHAAVKFIGDVMACNFNTDAYRYFGRNLEPIEKLLYAGSSEYNSLMAAFKQCLRVSSIVKTYVGCAVQAKIYFYNREGIFLVIDMFFSENGEPGNLGILHISVPDPAREKFL